MYRNLLNLFVTLLAFTSCSKSEPTISVVCEENNVGNSIIKWETMPFIEGKVKVYASLSPDSFTEDVPVAMANISDQQLTIVTSDPLQRYYYLMVFNDEYRVKVATRNINIPSIQNFRDLGGYKTQHGKSVKWGLVYRSAQIDSLDQCSYRELKNIGVKTVIDLRNFGELDNYPHLQKGFKRIHIPIETGNMERILVQLQEGSIKSDTVYQMVEHLNRDFIKKNTNELHLLFQTLLHKENYPLVIHCSSGKGRTGVSSALLLLMLGVNKEIAMADYRLSNDYFNIPKVTKYAYHLPVNSQEAITTLFSAQEGFLNAALDEIEKRYGDNDTFFKQGLRLNKTEIKQLQSILLE